MPGRVSVAGASAQLGDRASPGDDVRLDGRKLDLEACRAAAELLLYYKPLGEVTTRRDPQGRPTVFERLPPPAARTLDHRRTTRREYLRAAALHHRWRARAPPHAPLERDRARIPGAGSRARPGAGRSAGSSRGWSSRTVWRASIAWSPRSPLTVRAVTGLPRGAARGAQSRGAAAVGRGRPRGEPAAAHPLRADRAAARHAPGTSRKADAALGARLAQEVLDARPPTAAALTGRASASAAEARGGADPGLPPPVHGRPDHAAPGHAGQPHRPIRGPPKQITGQTRIDTPPGRNQNTRLVLRRGTQAANGSRL